MLQQEIRNGILQAKIDSLLQENTNLKEVVGLYKIYTDSLKSDLRDLREIIYLQREEDYRKSMKAVNLKWSITTKNEVYVRFDLIGRQDTLAHLQNSVILQIRVNQIQYKDNHVVRRDSLVCVEEGQASDRFYLAFNASINSQNISISYPSTGAFKRRKPTVKSYYEILILYKDILIGKEFISI